MFYAVLNKCITSWRKKREILNRKQIPEIRLNCTVYREHCEETQVCFESMKSSEK